ncbi:MAG TPA: protein translocase subunit SecD [Clostridiales bacterium]|nr:protein translocase subunit SecD [Clostridiales bacterium]
MSNRKSIIFLTIIAVFIIGLALLIIPLNGKESFQIGNTNYDYYWISTAIKQGLDLKGGMYAEYRANTEGISNPDKAIDGAISNLESLLFSRGYTEAIVTKQGTNEIRVEVPDIQDTEALMALIGKPATLEFKDKEGTLWVEGSKHLEDAAVAQQEGQYVISLQFNKAGTEAFAKATEHVYNNTDDKILQIYIDGEVFMEPKVNGVISDGRAVITSQEFAASYDKANEYAVKIKAGASEVKLTLLRSETISPSLGDEALMNSIIAAAIGLMLIYALMIWLYRVFGACASIALLIYVELLVVALAIVPWVQLTLPGIAGVILSIGMAVDANVIIFERIKETRTIGNRSIPSSVKTGFQKALIAILDSNITTIIGAIVMMIFGSTAIKSFAITLLIGIIISMFTAIFVTRLLINCFLALNDESDVMYGLRKREVLS